MVIHGIPRQRSLHGTLVRDDRKVLVGTAIRRTVVSVDVQAAGPHELDRRVVVDR